MMQDLEVDMARLTDGLPTKAEKIRKLGKAGYSRADIARYLGIRYQHVRNTLEAAGIPLRADGAGPDAGESGADDDARPALAEAAPRFDRFAESCDGYYPLNVDPDGGLALPAALRDAMMLDPDGRVTAHVEDGELRIVSPLAAIRRAQRIAQKYKKPGQSVVDEFLAERRAMWGEE
jgi:hypothetical protein